MNSRWKEVIFPFLAVVGLILFIVRSVMLLSRTDPLPSVVIMSLGLVLPSIVVIIFMVMLIGKIKEIKHWKDDALGNY